MLKRILGGIERVDTNYEVRERCVYAALLFAKRNGLEAGFRIDPSEPEWPVAYIELPTGQISWHMPRHPRPYDGHSTEEKYRRIRKWVNEQP